jgi:hypothetical protein
VIEVAARLGKMWTRETTAEGLAAHAVAAESTPANAAAHSAAARSGAAKAAAHMAAAKSATTKSTAHVAAAAETAAVSTAAPAETAASAAAARQRVSGQSPGESGSRRQNEHDLTQHCISPSDTTVSICLTTSSRPSGVIARTRSMSAQQDVVSGFRGGTRIGACQVDLIACTPRQPIYQSGAPMIAPGAIVACSRRNAFDARSADIVPRDKYARRAV